MLSEVSGLLISILPGAPSLYIDPNTGGMLFQLLAVFLALFSGILFFFSRQIKSFFARIRRSAHEEVPAEGEPGPENTEQPGKPEEP